MVFDFDPAKSAANRLKHGIDFDQAKSLWQDDGAISVSSKFLPEERFLRIARRAETYWTAVYTHRHGTIRIISVRRARASEVRIYDSQNNQR